MECDRRPDSPCAESSACGPEAEVAGGWTDWAAAWMTSGALLAGIVAARLLLSRPWRAMPGWFWWSVRIICSPSGLSSLWTWVILILRAVRGLRTLFWWSTRACFFVVAVISRLRWLPDLFRAISGSVNSAKQLFVSLMKLSQKIPGPSTLKTIKEQKTGCPVAGPSFKDSGLRLVLAGPHRESRRVVTETLLGFSLTAKGRVAHDAHECKIWRMEVDGREVTVVDTPDLLGSSLSTIQRAREALRSLQLTRPGPHAFLLVLSDLGSAAEALHNLVRLVGDGALNHVLLVFAWTEPSSSTPAQLSREDVERLTEVLSVCGQRAEIIDCQADSRKALGQRLLGRVVEMRLRRGHYTHELQRREELIRAELLADMANALAYKL
ncbi:GTPase IMAP family member 4-like isoform X2 [Denticeps clupeoides]|uniref:GTPase IMAP family member 4-like isoform X2 n=2 Tax=Denticeps clupeoides TaxID=299321 RepID=UPI0010A39DD6|nr:GTPase IMAP family member 4-like isoform X2 [Denticeps clupeoides]